MRVVSVTVRDFRCYASASLLLGDRVTVICGPNGAGKTNLLEALYLGSTGRSCRTATDREMIRFGERAARVELVSEADDGRHHLAVGISPSEVKRMTVDGNAVDRLLDSPARPLVSVFLPDRLELIKGVPAARRAHVDQLVAGMWPARVTNRRAYAQTLAQRNALLARVRAGISPAAALSAWDERLAVTGLELMRDRAEAVGAITPGYGALAAELGLGVGAEIRYRPRSRAPDTRSFVAELESRRDGDVERGFTGHGPHRDDLSFTREGRELRTYGSQGQQRLALLALLLAERQALCDQRDGSVLMLLDDVMSELDASRRAALVAALDAAEGQTVITTADADHVPVPVGAGVAYVHVADGIPSAVRDLAAAGAR